MPDSIDTVEVLPGSTEIYPGSRYDRCAPDIVDYSVAAMMIAATVCGLIMFVLCLWALWEDRRK